MRKAVVMARTGTPDIGVLISGRGSNLQALMDAIADGRLGARIRVVISNRADAAGLLRARAGGLDACVVPHAGYASRADYDGVLASELRARGVEWVCLAGFMRLLGPTFCDAYASRVLNIHPSLLPSFPGVAAQSQALQHGVKLSGATVHLVTAELDAGPIVAQAAVPVHDDDTEESLSARILEAEHAIYPTAVHRALHEEWQIVGRRVVFSGVASGRSVP
ncbi:MAG: phosphoribosylglycinamide formyltransferase [Vicinamibacterales bacterium]